MRFVPANILCAAALAFSAHLAQAAVVLGTGDPAGDFLSTFIGRKLPEFDAVGSFVTYNQSTDTFLFAGLMDGDIDPTHGGLYVWGVNRGAGTAGFAANGLNNVLFDSVVVFRANGAASIGATPLPAGTVHLFGNMVFGEVSGSMLPSTGFAKKDYTFNLWPRDGTLPMGFPQIADFAPDNENFHATVIGAPVPEPATVGMLGLGLGALVLVARRRLRAA